MRYDLTEFEWSVIEPLLPMDRRGPKPRDNRRVLNGIFWVLRAGAPWRDMPSQSDLAKAMQEKIMQDRTVGPAAEQLIYLWYVSAFFLPIDHAAASRNWLYGSPEQYQKSLLYTVVRAHAPMTEGGPPGYWATAPRI